MNSDIVIWIIAGLSTACVVLRPWRLPEAIWAAAGATALIASGLLPLSSALLGIEKGVDVYLFLIGMMMVSEIAREHHLFDWLAQKACEKAQGSSRRLFNLVFLVGTGVTVFLSNDATAVVLTPAVAAIALKAEVENPLPYLFICAFIANAASFVLPISNPANLVIYGAHLPSLLEWLPLYALPSAASILATYVALRIVLRANLESPIRGVSVVPKISGAGKSAAIGIALTAAVVLLASAFHLQLGLPTFLSALVTLAVLSVREHASPRNVLAGVSWSTIALVAGLFVLVEALVATGAIGELQSFLVASSGSTDSLSWTAGIGIALISNLVNNLPAALVAGTASHGVSGQPALREALLIGVDLGPNLSVTGSLATILWLQAMRRAGVEMTAGRFLKVGAVVMPPALLLSLTALLVVR